MRRQESGMDYARRQFIKSLTALAGMLLAPSALVAAEPDVIRRRLPSSGESIPVIGMGSWLTFSIDPDDEQEIAKRRRVLEAFFKHGGTVIDSSPMYGTSQEVIGRCLGRLTMPYNLFAATKVWVNGQRQGILQMERSRLLWGVDRFDLMQVHNLLDWRTHLDTLRAMKQDGQLRYIGITTSHGRRHEELIGIMQREPLDFVQFTYNLVDREAEQKLLPLAADKGIAVIINRPFQRAGLFDYVENKPLPPWTGDYGILNWAQFFLKFIVSHPAVTCAIPATSRVDHMQENMGACRGPLPDAAARRQMLAYFHSLT
jgi:diketogulonate reductase-like aldo/keto reductase